MINVIKSDIPEWLHKSPYLENLNYDEEFEMPELRLVNEINNLDNFIEVYKTSNYFIISPPKSSIKYFSKKVFDYLKNDDSLESKEFLLNLCSYKIKNFEHFRTIS